MGIFKKLLLEAKSSSDDAHDRGWLYKGHGYWKDKSGKTVARTIKGKLIPSKQTDTKSNSSQQKTNIRHSTKQPVAKNSIMHSPINPNNIRLHTDQSNVIPDFWKNEISQLSPRITSTAEVINKNPRFLKSAIKQLSHIEKHALEAMRSGNKKAFYENHTFLDSIAPAITMPSILKNGNVDMNYIKSDELYKDGSEMLNLYKKSQWLNDNTPKGLIGSDVTIPVRGTDKEETITQINSDNFPYLHFNDRGDLELDPEYYSEIDRRIPRPEDKY